jgi:hypothetical protein
VAALLFISATLLTAEPRCSANLAVQPSRSASNHHQVILEAYINETGPYAFLLDTGSQITIIDESLASDHKGGNCRCKSPRRRGKVRSC